MQPIKSRSGIAWSLNIHYSYTIFSILTKRPQIDQMPPAFDPFKSCGSFQLLMIFSIYYSQVVWSLSSV